MLVLLPRFGRAALERPPELLSLGGREDLPGARLERFVLGFE